MMNVWRVIRYLLTRITFLSLGLPIGRYLKQVNYIWSLPFEERNLYLNSELDRVKPISADGEEVKCLDSVLNASPLTKHDLQLHVRAPKPVGRIFTRHTAGTTGQPTKIWLSRLEIAKMLAVRDYCFRMHNLKLGYREARLWAEPNNNIRSSFRNFLLNRKVFSSNSKNSKRLVSDIEKWNPDYIYGYSSAVFDLAKNKNKESFRSLKAIICTAESITSEQKSYIEKKFFVPVLEEYGSTEFDIIAFSCKDKHLHLTNPWLVINQSNQGCLVTDVSRESQSLIKYCLGDEIELSDSECELLGNSLFVSRILGREGNQYAYIEKDNKFHSVIFSQMIYDYLTSNKDEFIFTVEQREYSVFCIILDRCPASGIDTFANYCRDYLFDKVETEFGISVSIASKHYFNSTKRTYFLQLIEDEV